MWARTGSLNCKQPVKSEMTFWTTPKTNPLAMDTAGGIGKKKTQSLRAIL